MAEAETTLPIFVYGTLRPGDVGFVETALAGRVECLGIAQVRGRLYHLGNYPGLVLGGSGLVTGELLLPRDEGVLSLLDEYEMYDPADEKGSEYLRVRINIVGSSLSCWIYVYNRLLDNTPIIPGGDWSR